MTFPSSRGRILIEVCYLKDHPPFICGVDGYINGEMFGDIETDLATEEGLSVFDAGEGSYLFSVHWEGPQTNEEGRIELPGYWDYARVGFEPMEVVPATVTDEALPF